MSALSVSFALIPWFRGRIDCGHAGTSADPARWGNPRVASLPNALTSRAFIDSSAYGTFICFRAFTLKRRRTHE